MSGDECHRAEPCGREYGQLPPHCNSRCLGQTSAHVNGGAADFFLVEVPRVAALFQLPDDMIGNRVRSSSVSANAMA